MFALSCQAPGVQVGEPVGVTVAVAVGVGEAEAVGVGVAVPQGTPPTMTACDR